MKSTVIVEAGMVVSVGVSEVVEFVGFVGVVGFEFVGVSEFVGFDGGGAATGSGKIEAVISLGIVMDDAGLEEDGALSIDRGDICGRVFSILSKGGGSGGRWGSSSERELRKESKERNLAAAS